MQNTAGNSYNHELNAPHEEIRDITEIYKHMFVWFIYNSIYLLRAISVSKWATLTVKPDAALP